MRSQHGMGASMNAGEPPGATAPIACARSTETSRAMRKTVLVGRRAEPGVTVHRGTEDRLHVVER